MLKIGWLKNKFGNDSIKMLFALILAFIIWILFVMDNRYSVYISYRVNITTGIEGHQNTVAANELLTIKGSGSGFYILHARIAERKSGKDISIEIDQDKLRLTDASKDLYTIAVPLIADRIEKAIGASLTVESIENTVLTFNIPKVNYKKVPVEETSLISFKPQYMQTGEMTFTPDSVLVYGTEAEIEDINHLDIRPIELKNVDKTIEGVAVLDNPRKLRIEPSSVRYSLDVSRYVERTGTITLKSVNMPSGKTMVILPSQVTIVCRMAFARINDRQASLPEFAVDYYNVINARGGEVIPVPVGDMTGVFSYTIEPKTVQCIITDE